MPHFVFEYSRQNCDAKTVKKLLATAHEVGAASNVMSADDIKARAIGYDDFQFAGDIDSFVHVTIRLLEGRTDAQKESLSVQMRTRLRAMLPDVDSISVDIRDMNPIAYKKDLLTV